MRIRADGLILAASLTAVAGHLAAQGTDGLRVFDGRWILVATNEASSAVPQLIAVERRPWRGSEEVVIARTFEGRTLTDTYQLGIVGGMAGGITGASVDPPTRTEFFSRWDGEAFSFGHVITSPPEHLSSHEERWTIDATGKLNVAVTERAGQGSPSFYSVVYIHQP